MFEAEKKALKRIVKSLQVSLGDELQTVIAFGSRIRGDFRADSDFDVLIVVKSEEIFFKEREFRISNQEKIALSDYRFEKAKETLTDGKIAFQSERYKMASNRAYYAVSHAVRSLLILKGADPVTHHR